MSEVLNRFRCLLDSDLDPKDDYTHKKPLLAHYTSLNNLESILKNEEIWLSNPLLMNDFEELRFGCVHGRQLIMEDTVLGNAFKNAQSKAYFYSELNEFFDHFEKEYALEVFVACFSAIDPSQTDGLLSMWRGYGNNGKGAALVLDAGKFGAVPDSPLIIGKVHYKDTKLRIQFLKNKILQISKFISLNRISHDEIREIAFAVFYWVLRFSLFTKHIGFEEEHEWRIVYSKYSDHSGALLGDAIHYFNGENGIESKLKLKIGPIPGVTTDDLSLENIIDRIILGPSVSTPLALKATKSMLTSIGKQGLCDRLHSSTIPYRAR